MFTSEFRRDKHSRALDLLPTPAPREGEQPAAGNDQPRQTRANDGPRPLMLIVALLLVVPPAVTS